MMTCKTHWSLAISKQNWRYFDVIGQSIFSRIGTQWISQPQQIYLIVTIYEAPPTSWNRSARGRSSPPSGWSDRNRTSARALQLYCSHSAGFEHVAAVTSGYRFHRVIIFRVCTAFIGIHPPHLWSAQCPMMTEARPWLSWLSSLLQDSLSPEDAGMQPKQYTDLRQK